MTDRERQLRGIDRILTLRNGKQIKIDEKKRRHSYGDILIEYVSNDKYGTPGWIAKNLDIDYVAYAVMDTRQVYFLQWTLLKAAWNANSQEWIACPPEIHKVSSANAGYNTLSLAIPIGMLYNAMNKIERVVVPEL